MLNCYKMLLYSLYYTLHFFKLICFILSSLRLLNLFTVLSKCMEAKQDSLLDYFNSELSTLTPRGVY